MKVIIAGSRGITDYNVIVTAIQKSTFSVTEVVSGGARGVDKLGEQFARLNKLALSVYPADWDKYGKSAGYKRNLQMADYADALIAIWDGESKGTKHMIDIAGKKGIPVYILTLVEGINSDD